MKQSSFLTMCLVMTLVVAVAAPPNLGAITNGTIDTRNIFSNVGALLLVTPDGTQAFQFCSGTLITPTVFLTAAHCAHFFNDFFAPQAFTLAVSFAKLVPTADLTNSGLLIHVTHIIADPRYVEADHRVFNPHHRSDPGDLAVAILPPSKTGGITPATLPSFGLLEQLAARNGLRGTSFIAVGYGSQDRFGTQQNPVPRMFAFATFGSLQVAYLQLSINPTLGNGGDCIGDSGGPHFLLTDGKLILVAVTSIRGDHVCRAMTEDYRLDTATAREFLSDFVVLP